MSGNRLAIIALVLLTGCQRAVPQAQMPTFAVFCLTPAHWQDAVSAMRKFGATHRLQLHGGVEKRSDGLENLNVYLARGYSYWWGDDLDFWLTSNPHVQGQTSLNGLSKKPWARSDLQMAHDLLRALRPLQCGANR
jgi:hypothetical protein